MELGKYADGRSLNYDETTQQFDVGGAPVSRADVVSYDQAGQVDWLTDDLRSWAQNLVSGETAPSAAPVQVAAQPAVGSGKGLFGFRSRTPWKMGVAGVYYLFAVVMSFSLVLSRKPYATNGKDIAIEVVNGLLMSLVLLSPALLLSDFGYREKLPLFKKRKVILSAVGLAVFFVLMVVTSALADGLHTAPYKVAAAKEAAEQKAEADAKTAAEEKAQAEADAKKAAKEEAERAAEASATAEAKRVADEKAAAEASAAAAAAAAAPKPAPKPAATPAPKPTPTTPTKTETKADYLRKVVIAELGAKTDDKPTIIEIADSGGDAYWLLRLNGGESLTNDMTKKGMWIDAKGIWERVFTERQDIDELAIFWYYPLVDAKGNTHDEIVMKLWMTKQNAADVKWDNVLMDNIPVIADDYWESPVFNN
jgi:uncharacterized membrane protein